MSADEGLVTRSLEEMQIEEESLLAEAARLRAEYDAALERIEKLRRESVDARPLDPKTSELLWSEAESLQDESRELLRLSVEKTLQAGEVKRRLSIRARIEAIDGSDEIWRKAVRAGK